MAMRRLTLTICAVLALAASPAAAVEEILHFKSDINVQADGSVLVTETIQVRAEGEEIRRGIYRDFPTDYRDRSGNPVRISFDVLGVTRDRHPESHHTERRGNGVRLYIGHKDRFLNPGIYTYEIRYRTDRQLGFFDDHDELYWNVTGNGWIFPIRRASASVSLPGGIPREDIRLAAYTGPRGSRAQDFEAAVDLRGRANFETTGELQPSEGLTIVVGWPKGYVAEPTPVDRAGYLLSDNRHVVFGLVGLAALLLYYLFAWIRVGRDPDRGTVIPLFEPPDNLSPAAMRYIMEMGFDDRAFASAVINLAVKGYLTISEEKGVLGLGRTYTLERTGVEPTAVLSGGEQKVARKLFPGTKRTLKLERENHSEISGAIKALKELLKTEYQKEHFLNNMGYFSVGILISAAILLAAAFAGGGSPLGPPLMFIVIWLVPWTVGTFFLWSARKFFMAAVFSFFLVGATVSFALTTSLIFVATIFLLILLNFVFYRLLKAPTRLGRRVMDKVEGFKMYLSTAEKHRLNTLTPPEKTPELFEKYLPYALALEVDQEWAEQFSGVLARATAADGEYRPSWYRGTGWNSYRPGESVSSLGSSLASAISSSSHAPGSSSGFGGGGSSGGGGGGGGGGGW
ncbi:MAG: DUF2207 domain-containing protein [bacterium]|nr:MAG: DUF2207 domain-containing protein [bacterium]